VFVHVYVYVFVYMHTYVYVHVYKPAGDVEFAGHAVHAPAPGESLYLPVSHTLHVPPLGPVYPALHSQSSRASLAAGDVELPGHVEHAAGPGESLYLPSSHAVHVPPLGPVYPAMHAQSPEGLITEWGGQSARVGVVVGGPLPAIRVWLKCISSSVLVPHGVKTLLVSWYTQQ